MNPGTLDRQIQIQRFYVTDDGFGQVEIWADHGEPIWAAKTDISDGERWRAGEVAADISARFIVRWSTFSAGLTPKDRMICEGRTFEIVGIKEGKGRHAWLEITAAARND